MEIIEVLQQIETHLRRIAEALDADRDAPSYQDTLAAYPGYNWSSINASVLESDDNGATRVIWRRHIYTRRSNPKFGHGVWFSRGAGRDDAGDLQYERLITFSTLSPVEPLPTSISARMRKAPTPSPTQTPEPTEPTEEEPAEISALDQFFPREGDAPRTPPESERKQFFRLLPIAIAAGLQPADANALTAIATRGSYTEPLTTLQEHLERLEADQS